jgi:hypothetical protein
VLCKMNKLVCMVIEAACDPSLNDPYDIIGNGDWTKVLRGRSLVSLLDHHQGDVEAAIGDMTMGEVPNKSLNSLW